MRSLRLYVTPRTAYLEEILRAALCQIAPQRDFELEVIDAVANPARAEADNIIATPLLVASSGGSNFVLLGCFDEAKAANFLHQNPD